MYSSSIHLILAFSDVKHEHTNKINSEVKNVWFLTKLTQWNYGAIKYNKQIIQELYTSVFFKCLIDFIKTRKQNNGNNNMG